MSTTRVSLYSRTYWDALMEVPMETFSEGKGKVDAAVSMVMGGFACNAARTIAGRLGSESVRVVTVASTLDVARIRAHLPADVVLDAIDPGDEGPGWPAITVIINPARECRILRDPVAHGDALWRADDVSSAALEAHLHVFGRLPADFVSDVLKRAPKGSRGAWVGGDDLPRDLEARLDLMCVNSKEAALLLGGKRSPKDAAQALVERATVPGAVRVVTGGGKAATAAAFDDGGQIRCYDASPGAVPREEIKRLLGVGDAFAAMFLTSACFDAEGNPRAQLDAASALDAAQATAARFITGSSDS